MATIILFEKEPVKADKSADKPIYDGFEGAKGDLLEFKKESEKGVAEFVSPDERFKAMVSDKEKILNILFIQCHKKGCDLHRFKLPEDQGKIDIFKVYDATSDGIPDILIRFKDGLIYYIKGTGMKEAD